MFGGPRRGFRLQWILFDGCLLPGEEVYNNGNHKIGKQAARRISNGQPNGPTFDGHWGELTVPARSCAAWLKASETPFATQLCLRCVQTRKTHISPKIRIIQGQGSVHKEVGNSGPRLPEVSMTL